MSSKVRIQGRSARAKAAEALAVIERLQAAKVANDNGTAEKQQVAS